MKTITEQYLNTLSVNIIKESEKQAELLGNSFNGLTGDQLYQAIKGHLGGEFIVKPEQQVKFSRYDINAVANSRFYRKSGQQLLMGLAIVVLLLVMAIRYIPNMTALGYNISYTVCGAIALVFVFVYSRKQSRARKELWRQLGREEKDEE